MGRLPPIKALPQDYVEVRHLVVTRLFTLIWLNILALVPMVLEFLLVWAWLKFVRPISAWPAGGLAWGLILFTLLLTIVLHEWLHGLAIRWAGHQPQYGIKPLKMVVYATADGAFFRRYEFIIVALAPLVGITLVGLLLLIFVPAELVAPISLGVIVNAGSAIGDLYMVWVVLRYPPIALVQDETDSIRVFMPSTTTA